MLLLAKIADERGHDYQPPAYFRSCDLANVKYLPPQLHAGRTPRQSQTDAGACRGRNGDVSVSSCLIRVVIRCCSRQRAKSETNMTSRTLACLVFACWKKAGLHTDAHCQRSARHIVAQVRRRTRRGSKNVRNAVMRSGTHGQWAACDRRANRKM